MLKYIKLKEEIKKYLKTIETDSPLPTHAMLSEKYNVSDITVRKALNELINEGLIYGIQRKGIYKARPKRAFLDVSILTDLVYFNKNPQFDINPGLMEALQHDMIESDMDLILSLTGNDPEREAALLEKLILRKPYGIIANPFPIRTNFEIYKKVVSQIPNFVFVDKYIPGADAHYVGTDNYNGAKELIKECEGQHYDVVFCLYSDQKSRLNSEIDRIRGFKDGLKNIGYDTLKENYDWTRFKEEYLSKLNKYKNILFITPRGISFSWVYSTIRDGLSECENCKVICFDKPEGEFPLNITISWYQQNAIEISKKAVELIKNNVTERQFIEFPGKIRHIN